MRHTIPLCLILALACNSNPEPTAPPVGTLQGVITSSLGPTLAGITIRIMPTASDSVPIGISEQGGFYSFANVPTGGGTIGLGTAPSGCTPPPSTPYGGVKSGGIVTVNITIPCTNTYGTLTGQVTNSQGVPIAGASVAVTPAFGHAPSPARTDSTGRYVVDSVPATLSETGMVTLANLPTACTVPAAVYYTGFSANAIDTTNVAVDCQTAATTTGLWVDGAYLLTPTLLASSGPRVPEDSCVNFNQQTANGVGPAAFDAAGDLWTAQPDLGSTIVEWTPAQLEKACTGQPTIAIPLPATATTLGAMAFDAHGTLWVTSAISPEILGYSAAQLASTASSPVTPAYTIAPASAGTMSPAVLAIPGGLAFDAAGDLWVANYFSVVEYTPAQLAAATTGSMGTSPLPAYLSDPYSAVNAGNPAQLALDYGYVAFDAQGDLWVSMTPQNDSSTFPIDTVLEFTPAQLASLGTNATPTPARSLVETTAQVNALYSFAALAFDANGNLWLGTLGGRFGAVIRYPAASLTGSGTAQPDITVTGPTPTFGISLAFDPTPTGLPINGSRAPRQQRLKSARPLPRRYTR